MSALAILAPSRLARLLTSDARNVSRDPMLIMGSIMALFPSLGLWLARPAIDEAGLDAFGIPALSRYFVPVALLLPAFLVGWVSGFLFLEDRDEGPLIAIEVTPIGKLGFMVYRVAATAFITAMITALALFLLLPNQDPWLAAPILLTVPANAVMGALILPALARNKVEGLALTKLTNLAAIMPLLAAPPSPFRLLGGVFPTYWLGEWLKLGGDATLSLWTAVPAGIVVHVVALATILRLNGRPG